MWNLLFYVKADQPGKEFNYCVLTTLQPIFDLKGVRNAHNVVVQCKRRCPEYEIATDTDDDGLTWEFSEKYFGGSKEKPRVFTAGKYQDLLDVTKRAPEARLAKMESAPAVAEFLEEALKSSAQDSPTFLGFWSHAGGWAVPIWYLLRQPEFSGPRKKQSEQVSKSFMSLPQLRLGIKAGLEKAGRQSLDVVAFNSCLMGCVEAAYELRTVARYMVASETSIPYTQWNQKPWLRDIGSATNMTPSDLLKSLVASFDAEHGEGVCISSLDLSRIDGLVTEIAKFNVLSSGFSAATWAQIREARDEVPTMGGTNGQFDVLTVDIINLFTRIARRCKDAGVAAQARRVAEACGLAVIESRAARNLSGRNGMSVFFPPRHSDFMRLDWRSRYEPGQSETAEFVKTSGWFDFLQGYWKGARRL